MEELVPGRTPGAHFGIAARHAKAADHAQAGGDAHTLTGELSDVT